MVNDAAQWATKIIDKEIPIFKNSVKAISQLTSRRDASVSELANVILRDPALTAKILKFANSSFYRSASQAKVNTVSRACVLLGFETIRELSLSLAIIDSLLNRGNRERLGKLLGEAFYAAVQAREMAEKLGAKNVEEIFIATLLHDLGEMSFWALADEQEISKMDAALKKSPNTPAAMVQKEILGFTFSDLSMHLLETWNLKETLGEILQDSATGSGRAGKIINFSREMAQCGKQDWEAESGKNLINRLTNFLNFNSTAGTRKFVKDNQQTAIDMASGYAPAVARHIPGLDVEMDAAAETETEVDETAFYPEPDPLLQLRILREVTAMLSGSLDLNLLIEALLEGIHRGVGMDRAIFALYDPLKSQIRAKYVLGLHGDYLMDNFVFPLRNNPGHPFHDCLFDRRKHIWVNNINLSEYNPKMMYEIKTILGVKAFFAGPIFANERPIGLLYADRQPSSRPLDEELFESFKHLGQQVSLSLEYISRREKPSSA